MNHVRTDSSHPFNSEYPVENRLPFLPPTPIYGDRSSSIKILRKPCEETFRSILTRGTRVTIRTIKWEITRKQEKNRVKGCENRDEGP